MDTPLARIACYNDLVEAFRARKDQLNLSDLVLDDIAGLTPGHAGKLLIGAKGITAVTLEPLMDALGVSFLMIEDPAKMARRGDVAQRERRATRRDHRVGRHAIARVMRELGRKSMAMLTDGQRAYLASKGGRSSAASLSPARRKAIARKAARARWRKAREQAEAA